MRGTARRGGNAPRQEAYGQHGGAPRSAVCQARYVHSEQGAEERDSNATEDAKFGVGQVQVLLDRLKQAG